MNSIKKDSKSKKTVKTYFPNGIVYCSAVYDDNKLVKCSKFHTNGKIAQRITYENGVMTIKENYNRCGERAETVYFAYNAEGNIEKITQEKINTTYTVIFNREAATNKILTVYVKQNNIIIRRVEYEYTATGINCTDADYNQCSTYKTFKLPVADESWLNVNPTISLVMRKLRTALELSA